MIQLSNISNSNGNGNGNNYGRFLNIQNQVVTQINLNLISCWQTTNQDATFAIRFNFARF